MHRTLLLQKGGRSISTRHGMRRILKSPLPIKEYIERAVETGIYRTNDEIEAAMESLRTGQSIDMEPRVAVDRFRRDVIRGTEVQDYPAEYHILSQHPPIPIPPRTPKKILRRMEAQQPKHPADKLVLKYMQRQAKPKATTEEFYQKLLGIQPPAENYSMGQKSAALSKAYAYAMKQYEVMRTEDVSEKEALSIVDRLLAEEKTREGHTSRKITQEVTGQEETVGGAASTGGSERPSSTTTGSSDDDGGGNGMTGGLRNTDLPSILHNKPRVVEGMLQWSRMLQNSGIPYREWTVGASTALDHWIARNILQLSEVTWHALLEGNDPTLLSRGQDIVAIRETLFPETVLDARSDDAMEEEDMEVPTEVEEEEEVRVPTFDDSPPEAREKSVEELLKSLRGLDDGKERQSSPTWSFADEKPSAVHQSSQVESRVEKDAIQILTEELQQWRAQNAKSPYDEWSGNEKQRFAAWLDKYINTLTSDADRRLVDLDETREALLSSPPQTEEESDNFWSSLQDETKADLFLQNLLQKGPPEGLPEMDKLFWTLPYEQQLEKLVNLGAVRPLFDDYMSDDDRKDFFRRYGDYLLDGVLLEHLVPDPQGAISGMDLGIETIRAWGIGKEDRFKLVKIPYRSGLSGTEEDDGTSGSDAAMERARALYQAWNQHKAGRARYEESLFVRGDLGLSYTTKSPNLIAKEKRDEEKRKEDEEKRWNK